MIAIFSDILEGLEILFEFICEKDWPAAFSSGKKIFEKIYIGKSND